MDKVFLRRLLIAAIAGAIAASPIVSAADDGSGTGDKGTDMVVDVVLLRPVGALATVVGAVVFVVGLPFTVPSGSVESSACELVRRPLAYTVTRPLGDIGGCGEARCDPCAARDGGTGPANK